MRRAFVLLFSLCLAGLGLAGCGVGNLDKYYTSETTEKLPRTEIIAVVDGGQDAEAVFKRMYDNRSYLRVGRLSFVGPREDDSVFMDYGKAVGADVVIISRRYVNSRVVDIDRGGGYGIASDHGTYGGNEAQFDPSFTPGMQDTTGRDSYIVRDYRHVAIFLRHVAG